MSLELISVADHIKLQEQRMGISNKKRSPKKVSTENVEFSTALPEVSHDRMEQH